MGACFSKKKEPAAPPPSSDPISSDPKIPIPIPKEKKKNKSDVAVKAENETKKEVKSPKQAAPEASAAAIPPPPAIPTPVEKKPVVFVITQTPKKTKSNSEEEKMAGKPKKPDPAELVFVGQPKADEVRTSSCTKEEVDAILIRCGRLSRSSSGKASSDTAGHKKYSGSKRSYDFDNDKCNINRDEEAEDWDQKLPVSRPSPRRRTPNRERSGSRERGKRVSRSPGRRSETPAASAGGGEKPKQPPAKMVSVPAREKGVSVEASGVKRASSTATAAAVNRRNASPRSRSPANASRVSNENAVAQPQSLSRSSSRKQEQSPSRRNPMAEIDDNSMRGNHSSSNANKVQKSSQIQTQNNISNCVRDRLMTCRAKEKQPEPEIVEFAKDSKGTNEIESMENQGAAARTRLSRRSSRDFDHIIGLNSDHNDAVNYTSLLLQDIHNYHQQNAGFSLPACVSKACSILEAVADLNSSSSDQSNNDNGRFGRKGLASNEPFVESEIVVKDDLMEPSLHKYISVRDLGGESEPQESAGSNSFVGQPWPYAWELNSVDSTDRNCNSQANNGEEAEETSVPEARLSRFRSGGSSSNSVASATGPSNKKRDVNHHCQLQRGGSGVGNKNRAQSLPAAAATS